MLLSKIRMRDYRCMKDVELSLARRTLLIGGNGTGKTSVLEAVDKALGAGRRNYAFREQDLAPGAAELSVDFEIRPDDGSVFTPEEHALFETHVDFDDEGHEMVSIRVVAGFEDDGVFRSRGAFLKSDGEEDGALDATTRGLIGFFYLPAARDARREFDDRGGLWSRLAGLLEAAHDPDRLDELAAEAGRELVGAVLGEDRLDTLAQTVERFVTAMHADSGLQAELRATAIDFRTLLRRTSLVVGREDELAPLDEQSTGLQTLALFGLFRAYLETAEGHLLGAGLEEPEIHLAPHVARSLIALAAEPGSQVLLTSHSPAVTDAVPIEDVRVLRLHDGSAVARAVSEGLFDREELARLQRELRSVGTEFMFARSVLLCEGQSELGALPEFARMMGVDFDLQGVTLVAVGGGGFLPFLKLLGTDGFDIPHAVVCDNDRTLLRLIGWLKDLSRLPDGVDPDDELGKDELDLLKTHGIFAWSTGDLETYLVREGGYAAFEQAADFLYGEGDLARFRAKKLREGIDDDDTQIIKHYTRLRRVRKPELAAECATRFGTVPHEIEALVGYVTSIAGSGDGFAVRT